MPRSAKGKRIRVWLLCGREGSYDDNPMSPPGWPADEKGGVNWTFDPAYPFTITHFIVIGED